VYLFIRASANTANLDAYRMPQQLLAEADKTWRRAKREEARASPTEFDLDVKRVLGLLDYKPVHLKVLRHALCTCPLVWAVAVSMDRAHAVIAHRMPIAPDSDRFPMQTTIQEDLFAVDIWLHGQEVAIMCLSQDKFTMNAVPAVHSQVCSRRRRSADLFTKVLYHVSTAWDVQRPAVPSPQPLGQTKMMQNLFTACKVPCVMVPQHIWVSLESDEMKQDFLQRHIQQTPSESILM
jgi:hypothetical protein